MKIIFLILVTEIFVSCNSNDTKVDTKALADSNLNSIANVIDISDANNLTDPHTNAVKDIVGTWRIYKDISRDGDKCDSVSIINGTCADKNTVMLTLITFRENGRYKLKSGFRGNAPREDSGTWKITGTKYNIDLILFESDTKKDGVGSAKKAVNTYIIQNISFRQLVLIDIGLFNTMYFIPAPRPINNK